MSPRHYTVTPPLFNPPEIGFGSEVDSQQSYALFIRFYLTVESSDQPMSNSEEILSTSEEDPETSSNQNPHKLFLLGYIPYAKHNPILKAITNDLLSHYYVSCNASKWQDANGEPSRSRALMANADALVFFINEQTLRDENCLLTIQYAWNLTLPILMLRPPMTKLIINRDENREREKILHVGECAIVRSSSGEPWQLLNNGNSETIDYRLLQDILHQGFRLSTLYDPKSHTKSMKRIRRKLSSIFVSTNSLLPLSKGGSSSSSQPHFYLSPSNSSLCDTQKLPKSREAVIKSSLTRKVETRRQSGSFGENKMHLNLSMSTGNLCRTGVVRTPYPKSKQFQFEDDRGDEEDETDEDDSDLVSIKTRSGRRRNILKSPPPPDRVPSSVGGSEVDEKEETSLKPIPDNIKATMFKTPTLDLPVDDDSEIDADAFSIPPPTPITPGSGLFSIPSGRNGENSSRSRIASKRLGSVTSRTSSLDRRMSLSCLEDMSNYQKTQYLVFPLRDSTKKPYLLKFPEDMHEEEEKHGGSVWGSDTSLEEEIKLAGKINAGIVVDYMDDSPIVSPAPYLGDLN